jgi:glutathione S-transferase
MITIIHLDTSRSERIVWLMEELALPYAMEIIHRTPNIAAPESLKAFHPLGRAPIIRDGDTVLAESGAIVEYIIARYGEGRLSVQPFAPNYAQYVYWLHYAEGSLMLQLLREWTLERNMPNADEAPGMPRIREATQTHLAFIDAHLATTPYFAGDTLTGADIMMVFPFGTLRQFRTLDLAAFPAIEAYLARIEARPAYQRAMVKAGPGVKD